MLLIGRNEKRNRNSLSERLAVSFFGFFVFGRKFKGSEPPASGREGLEPLGSGEIIVENSNNPLKIEMIPSFQDVSRMPSKHLHSTKSGPRSRQRYGRSQKEIERH